MIAAIRLVWWEYWNNQVILNPFWFVISILTFAIFPWVVIARYWEFGAEGCRSVLRDIEGKGGVK